MLSWADMDDPNIQLDPKPSTWSKSNSSITQTYLPCNPIGLPYMCIVSHLHSYTPLLFSSFSLIFLPPFPFSPVSLFPVPLALSPLRSPLSMANTNNNYCCPLLSLLSQANDSHHYYHPTLFLSYAVLHCHHLSSIFSLPLPSPLSILNAIFHLSPGLIGIWWYPLLKSSFENQLELARRSSISSSQGIRKGYLIVILLIARLSTHPPRPIFLRG